ncbi:hypothetical protein, partial [Streptomyces sp. 8L]|uniref:hypothetical protein n=1 Tax=Streptomyces sp. 8L TaxID=2877242 RepID=UPI001CD35721
MASDASAADARARARTGGARYGREAAVHTGTTPDGAHAPRRWGPEGTGAAGTGVGGSESSGAGAGRTPPEPAVVGRADGGRTGVDRSDVGGTGVGGTSVGGIGRAADTGWDNGGDGGDEAEDGGDASGAGFRRGAPRGTADPVKLLLHRHRRLCESAVDPLEIAAGLEAHGLTDRAALSGFRHRDVFALAEELYARVPHDGEAPGPAPVTRTARSGPASWVLLTLLPGAPAALTLLALCHLEGPARLGAVAAGACALVWSVAASLRRGPLRSGGRPARAAGVWAAWLLAYAVCGDGALHALLGGGPDAARHPDLVPLVALSCAVAPAAWCARLFSVQARRRLAESRSLADFAADTRPLLLAAVALYAVALTAIGLLVPLVFHGRVPLGPLVGLGTLLLLARLLAVHGFPGAAASGLAAACAAEALAAGSVLAGRLPGCAALGAPAAQLVRAWGA